ncbi:MAG TPA: hypothetical protein VG096_15375 [Bryobacteraceae bacterium]|jgi:hypothetical protein|nr:hypothetical protein [Bryobacteraceae bacterium]
MADTYWHGAGRSKTTTLDGKFEIRFVERCYDGCPRWYDDEVWKHVNGVPDDTNHLLDREEPVKEAAKDAHDRTPLYGKDYQGSWFLSPCVNPSCTLRTWEMIDLPDGEYTFVDSANEPRFSSVHEAFPSSDQLKSSIRAELAAMAKGDRGGLTRKCAVCKEERPLFKIIPIREKWIYLLTGSGKSLQPKWEVYAESDARGRIHTRFAGGRFTDSPFMPYVNGLKVQMSKWENDLWHFFLSPVRLGPKALDLLCRSVQDEAPWSPHVPVMGGYQPWAATTARRFHAEQIPTLYEYIPLVDPFAWAAMANEADYIPILDAQRVLATNENEQSKVFIAGTLKQAIHPSRPAKANAHGKEVRVAFDPFDIGKALQPAPKSTHASNLADAWMRRYDDMTGYLAREVDQAFCRVRHSVLHAPGHRVIEVSCQEHVADPNFLQFGLLHWQHLLTESLACPSGKEFVKSLVQDDALAERIPQANILRCENLTKTSPYIQKFGPAVPAQVFSSLIPVLIATSGPVRMPSGVTDPPETISKFFESVSREPYIMGDDEADFLAKSAEIASEHMQKNFDRFMGQFNAAKAASTGRYLGIFKSTKAISTIWGLGVRWHKKLNDRHQGYWEHFDAVRGMYLEIPSEGAKLVGEWAVETVERRLKLARRNPALEELAHPEIRWESRSIDELLSFEKSADKIKYAKSGLKLLEVVGFITSMLDLLSESQQAMDASRAGDHGAAIGHGIEAAGALLTIAPVAAYYMGLLSAAELEVWGGPIGLIAAAITATGALLVYLWSLTDLAIFAAHSFLGQEYGKGEWYDETGKFWMAGQSWPVLRCGVLESEEEAPNRFVLQAAALLRMFCAFTVTVDIRSYGGGMIRPGLIPDGGVFAVSVTWRSDPQSGRASEETYAAHIFPAMQRWEWINGEPTDSKIEFLQAPAGIRVTVIPTPACTNGSYTFRVRLFQMGRCDLLSLPAEDEWVEVSSYRPGMLVRSAEVN